MKSCLPIPLLFLTLLTTRAEVVQVAGPDSIARSVTTTNTFTAATKPVKVFNVVVYNSWGNDIWLHVFNTTSKPAAGAVPYLAPVLIPANHTGGYDFPNGYNFSTGVTICTSTTDVTFTNAGAVFLINASYYGRAY